MPEPKLICAYKNDGYRYRTLCKRDAGVVEMRKPWSDTVALHFSDVTCEACRRTKMYRDRRASLEGKQDADATWRSIDWAISDQFKREEHE